MFIYYIFCYIIYRQHRGEVVGLAFSPDGEFMYSADSQGSLALYNSSDEDYNVIRVACMYTLISIMNLNKLSHIVKHSHRQSIKFY